MTGSFYLSRVILLIFAGTIYLLAATAQHLEMALMEESNRALTESTYNTVTLDPLEYSILKEIYRTMGGKNWKWNPDPNYGKKWVFNNDTKNNPCNSRWQGLFCYPEMSDQGVGNIYYIGLTGYGLTGTLPSNMFNFKKLMYLYMSENYIQGQLPSVAQLPMLLLMNFSYNSLDGTIPECLGKATQLQLLYLSNNQLVGPIPDTFSLLTEMQFLYLLNNQLTGTLPQDIGNLRKLSFLNLGVNLFRGTLPESISNLTNLEVLYLNNNSFSGSFPRMLPYSLTKLSLECNKLEGLVPQIFENYVNLTVLKLNDNFFTGPPPICLATLRHLEILQLHLNQFTGPIEVLFDPLVQTKLTNIDLSHNALSGELPGSIFQLPALKTIAAVKNCFSGTLPDSICDAKTLNVISLDGLTSSTACVEYMWDPLHYFKSGYFAKSMRGRIPDCVWSLPSLTSLHLSGNSFTGKLFNPNSTTSSSDSVSSSVATSSSGGVYSMVRSLLGTPITPTTTTTTTYTSNTNAPLTKHHDPTIDTTPGGISPTLKNVSLSHNRLSGSIPSELLKNTFSSLDLSYNKLQGHVDDLQYANLQNTSSVIGSSIKLKVNRLTGDLPGNLEHAYGVNILEGNVFACTAYSGLPHHDPAYHYYVCGSDELNQSMIAFICVGCVLFVVAVFTVCVYFYSYVPYDLLYKSIHNFKFRVQNTVYYVHKYTTAVGIQLDANLSVHHKLRPHIEKYANYVRFLSSMNLMRRMFVYIAAVVILVCLPIYLMYYIQNYSSHVDRYSWITTTAFLSGQTPAITLFAVWNVMCAVVVGSVLYIYNKKTTLHTISERYSSSSSGDRYSLDIPVTPNTSMKNGDSTCTNTIANSTTVPCPATDTTTIPVRSSLYTNNSNNSSANSLNENTTALLNAVEAGHSPTNPRHSSSSNSSGSSSSSSGNSKLTANTTTTRNPRRCPVRFADEVIISDEAQHNATTNPNTNTTHNNTTDTTSNTTTEAEQGGDSDPESDESAHLLSSSSRSTTSSSSHSSAGSTTNTTNTKHNKHKHKTNTNTSTTNTNNTSTDNLDASTDSRSSYSARASSIIQRVNRKLPLLSILPMSILFILNAFATIAANIVYVYIMLSPIVSSALFFVQITMAVFKLFWNLVVVRKLISHVPYNKESIRAHSLMLIFNTLVAPCLASVVTDSQCFSDLLFGSNLTTTSYSYQTCLEAYQQYDGAGQYTTVCTHYDDIVYTTDFNPPFVYNYSCGSSILTSYIPVYIYSYTMLALLLPLAFLLLSAAPTAYIPTFILSQIDGFLRPQDRNDNLDPLFDSGRSSNGSSMTSVFVRFQHIFKARSVQALMVQHLTMLLTFGITSPMLAFVIACAMLVDSYILQTLMIRYVEFQTRSSVFFDTFNTNGSGSNSNSGGSDRDSMGSTGSEEVGGVVISGTANTAITANTANKTVSVVSNTSSSNTYTNIKTTTAQRTLSTGSEAECRLSDASASTTSTDTHSQHSNSNSVQDSIVSRLYEEERLAELDSICGGTYRSVHHTIWLVYYCCVIFYSALLFDIVGDARGLESAISVPISGLAVGAFFRLSLSSIVVCVRKCMQSKEERSLSMYKQHKRSSYDLIDSINNNTTSGTNATNHTHSVDNDLATALLPSDEHYAMHGQLGPPACADPEHENIYI